MSRLLMLICCLLAAALPASTALAGGEPARPVVLELLGDYAGKPMVITVNDDVVVDGTLPLHPAEGLTDRYPVLVHDVLDINVSLDGAEVLQKRYQLDGHNLVRLLFQGSQVEAFLTNDGAEGGR